MKILFNREKLGILSALGIFVPIFSQAQTDQNSARKPNIIMILADDLGWGDVGYNGNSEVKTAAIDGMTREGVTFTNSYSASPLSSPARGSILTGRHPFRFGVLAAHTGGLKAAEVTIPEICKDNGYTTGFFGKWHLGWIESDPEDISDTGFYSPPQHHGFDEVFATRSAVPTWDPTMTPFNFNSWGNVAGEPWKGSRYLHNGEVVTENLSGDDSRVIMDRVLPFISKSIEEGKPFMTCVWFHAPHEPVIAGPEYLKMYENIENETKRHYYGCITAMDDQIKRLMDYLEEQEIAENTIICFSSDNGPADPMVRKGAASAGDFRGHKHMVYEGGVRVPNIMVWKDHIEGGKKVFTQMSSCDYLPTLVDMANLEFTPSNRYILDGISLKPSLEDGSFERTKSIFVGWMRIYRDIYGRALVKNNYKLVYSEHSQSPELYDLSVDPSESNNIIEQQPFLARTMMNEMMQLEKSYQASRDGNDYTSY